MKLLICRIAEGLGWCAGRVFRGVYIGWWISGYRAGYWHPKQPPTPSGQWGHVTFIGPQRPR